MAPDLAAAARRGARLGVAPSAFIVAAFLLGLVNTDSSYVSALLTLTWPASVAALVVVCLRAGASEGRRGGAWPGRLAAGASAGLVSVGLVLVLHNGLTLADSGLGISPFVLGLQGGHVSGDSFATVASRTLTVSVVATSAALTLAGGPLGAVLAALCGPLGSLWSHGPQTPRGTTGV